MRAGQHEFNAEGDILFCRLRGDFTVEDVIPMLKLAEEVEAKYGYYLTIADIRELGHVHPAVRQHGAQWARSHNPAACACYGGSLLARAIVTLTMRAITLVRRQPSPVVFFSTEADARSWLTERRAQLTARL